MLGIVVSLALSITTPRPSIEATRAFERGPPTDTPPPVPARRARARFASKMTPALAIVKSPASERDGELAP